MTATMYGWLIVCPSPMGKGLSSYASSRKDSSTNKCRGTSPRAESTLGSLIPLATSCFCTMFSRACANSIMLFTPTAALSTRHINHKSSVFLQFACLKELFGSDRVFLDICTLGILNIFFLNPSASVCGGNSRIYLLIHELGKSVREYRRHAHHPIQSLCR